MTVFVDDDRGSHPEDLLLLQTGHVHLVRHRWAVERLASDLTALGYDLAAVAAGSCASSEDILPAVIAAVPGWPAGYGARKWDAFADACADYLAGASTPRRVLLFDQFDRFARQDRGAAQTLLDILASAGHWHLLFGRRLGSNQ